MKEYELEREKGEANRPAFTAAKWPGVKVKEGERIELTARVKDIADGNMATFQVWKKGQDPLVHIAQWQASAAVEGGMAKAVWTARPIDMGDGPLPEEDPEFFFTVHSAWCPFGRSGMLTVELKRPELSDLKWEKILYDEEGNETGTEETDKIEWGTTAIMTANVENIDDGEFATMQVYEQDHTANNEMIFEDTVKVTNGIVKTKWVVKNRKIAEKLAENEEPAFVYQVRYRSAMKESSSLKANFVYFHKHILSKNTDDAGYSFTLESEDGSYSKKLDVRSYLAKNGSYAMLKFDSLVPGKTYSLTYNGPIENVLWTGVDFLKLILGQ
jgi:hypothetical protein